MFLGNEAYTDNNGHKRKYGRFKWWNLEPKNLGGLVALGKDGSESTFSVSQFNEQQMGTIESLLATISKKTDHKKAAEAAEAARAAWVLQQHFLLFVHEAGHQLQRFIAAMSTPSASTPRPASDA